MEEEKRFLWIVPKNPLPITDGARVATSMLLNGLSEQKIDVDLVILAEYDEVVDFADIRKHLGVKNIFVVRREKNLHSITSLLNSFINKPYLPVTLSKFANQLVKERIKSIVEDSLWNNQESSCLDNYNNWQCIVYDGLHASAFLEHFGKYKGFTNKNIKVIYRAHNYESELWLGRAKKESNFIFKIFLLFQYLLMKRYEKSLLRNVDGVAAVSPEDISNFNKISSSSVYQIVPIARDFKEILTNDYGDNSGLIKKEFLFVGRLDWLPNKEGLKWFLDNVWQEAVKEDSLLSLTIIGSGESGWLIPYCSFESINFFGQVNDLEPFYQKAQAVVVPVFYGSGTRVKVIEAASFCRVCLGTKLGVASGLGFVAGEHYVKLESASDWLDFFASYNSKDLYEMGRNAYHLLKEDYSIENATKKFLDLCNIIIHKS